jgi:type IV pilus assembly protein PilQ
MNRARLTFKAFILLIGIAFSLIACGTADVTTRPTDMSGDQPEAAGSSAPTLVGIKAEAAGNQTRVVLEGNQYLAYTARLDDVSPILVVDVAAQSAPEVSGLTMVRSGAVDKVQVEPQGSPQGQTRVSVIMTQKSPYSVTRDGNKLVVVVENLPGMGQPMEDVALTPEQTSPGTAVIDAVDFKPLGEGGRTRLTIKANKVVTPQVLSKDNGRTVVLSMSPASISTHLARPLDTAYYYSSVNYIKPTQASGHSVDFLIRLREMVPYHLAQKGVYTYLDFDPSGVPPKTAKTGTTPIITAPGLVMTAPDGTQATLGRPAAVSTVSGQAGDTGPARQSILDRPKVYTGKKMSLDFQNADIHNILRLIGEVSGKNVVVSDRVTGRVTLKLEEVPWDQALDVILSSNQLGMVESGNVIRVDTISTLLDEKSQIVAEHTKETELQATAPLQKKVFTPKYRSAPDIGKEMEKLFAAAGGTQTAKRGRVAIIGNDIFVEADDETMPQMADIFTKLDRPTDQILIEARIVEASTDFSRNLGVNWGGNSGRTFVTRNADTDQPTYSYGAEPNMLNAYGAFGGGQAGHGGSAINLINPTAMGMALGFGYIGEFFNLDAKLYALEATGEGRIVSAPRIMAKNDEEVHIQQGQEVPYTTVDADGNPSTSFKDATLMLKVKPHVENNGRVISLDILVTKKSPIYGILPENPPIDTKEAQTKLMVKDGETVVIGGIIIDDQQKSVNKVPALHKIPLLGHLFKSESVQNSKTELLIFLTSHIIPVVI